MAAENFSKRMAASVAGALAAAEPASADTPTLIDLALTVSSTTKAELARQLGVSAQRVSDFVGGRRRPSRRALDTAAALSAAVARTTPAPRTSRVLEVSRQRL